MGSDSRRDPGARREPSEMERKASRAVRKAKEEGRRLGVPNDYSINGILYYERPSARAIQ